MHRILTRLAIVAVAACSLAIDFLVSSVTAMIGLVPAFATGDEFRFANSHPRSIFETRRAGLA